MNHSVKMLIPISLGVIAAMINFAVMSSSTKKVKFIAVNTDVSVDTEFTTEMLTELPVPNEFKNLRGKAVPWSERGVLIGQKPSRHLSQGDVVLFQDIAMHGASLDIQDGQSALLVSVGSLNIPPGHMRIGDKVSFRLPSKYEVTKRASRPEVAESEWVGPFTITSIDGRLSNVIDYKSMGTRYVSDVTVLYPADKDLKDNSALSENLKKLEEFTDRQRTSSNAKMAGIRFHKDERN